MRLDFSLNILVAMNYFTDKDKRVLTTTTGENPSGLPVFKELESVLDRVKPLADLRNKLFASYPSDGALWDA